MTDDDDCYCGGGARDGEGILFLAGATMILCSTWEMFAVAGAVAVGVLAVWAYRGRRA